MKKKVWRGNTISSIVLGTAQLGMKYGIANDRGQPTCKQAIDIIKSAIKFGVNTFDTAQAYGNSEAIIGDSLQSLDMQTTIHLITKLSPQLNPNENNRILESIERSRRHLHKKFIWGIMLHRGEWLAHWRKGLGKLLRIEKDAGRIAYIGVSVYSTEEALRALRNKDIDFIQAPCSIFDQHLLKSEIIKYANSINKLCFVRSIFLQGLLLLSQKAVAQKMPSAVNAIQKWRSICNDLKLSPKQLAMKFALSLNTPLCIGIENKAQIEECVELSNNSALSKEDIVYITKILNPVLEESIYNPTLWNIKN
jgi:aryl-alcohol dehydrogenase-like predicted oxidoreductase